MERKFLVLGSGQTAPCDAMQSAATLLERELRLAGAPAIAMQGAFWEIASEAQEEEAEKSKRKSKRHG
jgi:Pyruvate/2-oxoacid:ferredoxin oxidoreductase gamma subunit